MNTGDLITSFLNNEMNPAQEREFLLSVAASDTQRLALKSHVMLDRVLSQQVQRASVPDSVRGVIFSAAAASLAEPLPAPQAASKTPAAEGGFASRLRAFATRAAMPMVATMMTVAGFAAGYYTSSETGTNPETRTVSMAVPAATVTPRVADQAPVVSDPVKTLQQKSVMASTEGAVVEQPASRAVEHVAVSTPVRPVSPSIVRHKAASHDIHRSGSSASAVTTSHSVSPTTIDSSNVSSRSSVDPDNGSIEVATPKIRKSGDTNSNQPENNKENP
jgi:hypothetical protein